MLCIVCGVDHRSVRVLVTVVVVVVVVVVVFCCQCGPSCSSNSRGISCLFV